MEGILRISTRAKLALHAMAYLVRRGNQANSTVGRIAHALRASENHLSRIMQRLVREGFLHSKRGPSGGFGLLRPAGSISLLELVEVFDGPLANHNCILGRKTCLHGGCALGALLVHVNYQVKMFLEFHTLSSMLATDRDYARFLATLSGQSPLGPSQRLTRKLRRRQP